MTTRMLAGMLAALALLAAAPAADAGELHTLFDLSLSWLDGGITLGGRVDRPLGPTSGSLTGRLRRGGVGLDGWLDDRGRTWLFEFDADVEGGLRAIVRRPPLRI